MSPLGEHELEERVGIEATRAVRTRRATRARRACLIPPRRITKNSRLGFRAPRTTTLKGDDEQSPRWRRGNSLLDRDLASNVTLGARDYDPSVGRWTSKEPKRFRAPGGNLYAYALGDALNLQDVSGLDVCVYRSSQGYRHEWIEIGGDPARSYGFWPYDGIFGGRSNLQSPDASHLSERFSSETELTCHPASSAEELELERWIQKTYDVNQASERNPYFLGISDCTTFTAGAVEELKRIQRDPWQIASDIFWGLW